MDLRLTDEQQALRDAARETLARECSPELARRRYDDPAARADDLWRHVTDAGWTAICVPERYGGLGLGATELALVLVEAGRALLPVPLWETSALSVGLAVAADDAALLGKLAADPLRCTAALDVADPDRTATGVPRADEADVVLAVVREGGGYLLVAVDPTGLRRHATVDATRPLCDLSLAGAAVVGPLPDPAAAFALGTLGLAAELAGAARWLLDTTVAYVSTREQFGVPVGSFQAVQHQCADMLVAVERAAASVRWAAWCLDADDPDWRRALAVAKASAGDSARLAAKTAVQLHGGIGYTWEHDLHLYVRRVYTAEPLLGGSDRQHDHLASLLLP